jgi:CRP-like cAMP-binding protein
MKRQSLPPPPFDLTTYFPADVVSHWTTQFDSDAVIFAQGAPADGVFHVLEGQVKLAVLAKTGKEAVVGMLGSGDFFGEGCLAGQHARMATASAIAPTVAVRIPTKEMLHLLHNKAKVSDRFIAHMLARNIRIEEDLVDQLFNSSEKRLARMLLLLAQYGKGDSVDHELPKLSQETLADMVGTTRSRVNFFMNKFRRLGFIEYNGAIKVKNSLLSVVLHD